MIVSGWAARASRYVCLGRVGVDRWGRPAWLGLTIVGAAMLVLVILYGGGSDLQSYWRLDFGDLYGNARLGLGGQAAFRYSPPIAYLFAPLGLLSFDLARLLWLAVAVGSLALVARRWTLATIALYPVALELAAGPNVHLELAAAIAFGFRWPALWSLVLLTKVTPGVGLLWFAVRREWRSLGIALGATAAVAGASFVVTPDLWREWIAMLAGSAGQSLPADVPHLAVPLAVRLSAAALLVAWGARTDRRWTVALAATLALPTLWPAGMAMLVGVLRPDGRRTAA